ncbi:MAG: CoA transferase [Chloroflexi bacterium]|nr:CoA transferase [Chloroflexota bacterium]MDA1146053.1 CoA transferase [Chloroflexota bacterium]
MLSCCRWHIRDGNRRNPPASPCCEELPLASLLDGIRVLDLSDWVAGSYCARVLADYGATVTRIEEIDGGRLRREGPFVGDDVHLEKSLLFLHLNANKRGVTLDLESAGGQDLVRRLAAQSDIVIDDRGPDALDQLGIGWDALSAGRDDLVMASITPFGLTGPWRNYRASELTLQAMGGPLHINGTPDREPVKSGGYVAHVHAGIGAAFSVMIARLRVEAGGAGDRVDLAIYETQSGFRDRRTPSLMGAAYAGYPAKRQGGGSIIARGVRPAADGYVNILGHSPRYFGKFLTLIERPDLNDRAESKLPPPQMPQDFIDEVEASYLTWLLQRTKQQVVMETQAIGALGGAVYDTGDLLTDPHYRSRGVWDTIDHPVAGPAEHAGRQLILSETPRAPVHHAPLLGQHNRTVLVDELGLDPADFEALQGSGVIGASTEVPA